MWVGNTHIKFDPMKSLGSKHYILLEQTRRFIIFLHENVLSNPAPQQSDIRILLVFVGIYPNHRITYKDRQIHSNTVSNTEEEEKVMARLFDMILKMTFLWYP